MSIKSKYYVHNLHLKKPELFLKEDPHLEKLEDATFIFKSDLLREIPMDIPGIYTITGGRQIGKTTLLKQWMAELLAKNISPASIYFITAELIDDHHQLVSEIQSLETEVRYLIIDEITYVKDWDKGIKFLADSGLFKNKMVILSGSDMMVIQEARTRFPGRRGRHPNPDFSYHPLTFAQTVGLKTGKKTWDIRDAGDIDDTELKKYFSEYLVHGGFLTAINDLAKNGKIQDATYTTYSDWVRGDFLKRNKQEHYLEAIITGLIKRYGSQVTWNALAKELPIDHHQTISEYIHLLERCGICIVLKALREDKLQGSPKKAKKIYFTDPFIMKALSLWAKINTQVQVDIEGSIVEGIIASHFAGKHPTYYISSTGEVDIALVKNNKIYPIEIKWSNQIRSKDLKQIRKYDNGEIWARFEDLTTIPPTHSLLKRLIII